ncbi:MAG TPA: hypothetical protein VFS99_04980 [Xanthomonadaceae bacterium]|nr:hypothetical protein [Xanthomonadaceae bacterium]
MFARAFRFDTSRLQAAFAPRKPRNPLLRLLAGIVGLVVLAAMLVVGLFVGTAMLIAGLGLRLLRQRNRPAAARPRDVVEGEYRIVGKPGLPLAR